MNRCLVTAQTAKHYFVSFQPATRVFTTKVVVFLLEHWSSFSVMQSRLKDRWTWRHASTLETRLSYTSDCFETFPFPADDPRTVLPELEALGEQLYHARAAYMVDTDQGLTKTYNALKDPACTDERILTLRRLHEEMDAAVLRAYPRLAGVGSPDPNVIGWSDIPVPPFCIATEEDKAALQAFEDEVIDRLFVLNEERAKKEQALGQAGKKGGKGKAASGTKAKGSKGKADAVDASASASAGAESAEAGASADAVRMGKAEGTKAGGAKAGGAAKGKKGAPPEGQGSLF
jgi:hypothetical protein